MNIYLQGLTMGLAYVAPIGLQNLFVINSALTQKRSRVYITALIVIFWDISLGVACFLGRSDDHRRDDRHVCRHSAVPHRLGHYHSRGHIYRQPDQRAPLRPDRPACRCGR